ncbi:MAG: TonB-dependent receptor plug domain-containing protein [Sphingobacteriaceae bacterium]|nr:TonB-dependent receptor plug domain-containing protein [Sphingobacteriaceae bacterium]
MKPRYAFFLFILFSSALCYSFITDDDPLKVFLAKLDRYRNNYPQEKVHIHTDKPYYSIGDTIWFKSYVVSAESNQLSNLSKILYVELINEKDSVKKVLRLSVIAGLSWGDFTLADSLTEGNYRIRAYTNWMRNFDEAYFFDKTIKIGNSLSSEVVSNVNYTYTKTGVREHVDADVVYTTIKGEPLKNREVSYDIELDHRNILKGTGKTDSLGKLKIKFTNAQPFVLKSGKINTYIKLNEKSLVKKSFPVKTTSASADVQFFPESGSLVTNIRSRVAFKVVGADGLGKTVTGYVTDQDGATVSEFSSEYAGMGTFLFTPLKDKIYTAVVKFDDGSEKKVDLPAASETGYVISIHDSGAENIVVKVIAAKALNNDELILIGQANGLTHFMARNKLSNNVLSAVVPKKRFPGGVIQFTLFNSSYQPLAERLVFIRHPNALNLTLSTEKPVYSKREKVKMAFRALDSAGKAAQGSFSISVTDETQVPFDDSREVTILSNLLLSSDLKGYIENPNYYFTDLSPAKDRALDNLMLTQGWRKFEWNTITSENFPALVFEPEKTLTISGKIVNPDSSPAPGAKVTLLSSAGTGMVLETLTNSQGQFGFDSLMFNDSTSFIVQARNFKGKKNVEILINRNLQHIVTKSQNAASVEINVNQSLLPYITTRNQQFAEMRQNGLLRRSIVLEEVKVTEVKPKVKNSSNLNGAGNADAVVTAAELKDCQNLAFCLQGRIAGLVVQNGIAYLTRSMYSSFSGPVPMQLVVDGVYVDPSYLSILNPSDIETIEVLKGISNTAIYGLRGGGGVLIITTKRGERNMTSRSFAQGIAAYSPVGYHTARQFYSPKYDTSPSGMPDWRTTIFWAPNVLTDTDGNASVEFFTADKPGTYKAVIEGLDLKGAVTRQVYRFSVK